jgi:hypothetical protein
MIYLASPYSSPDPRVRQERFLLACQAVGTILKRGYIVFSPVVHSHPVAMECDLPTDWPFWERIDLAYLWKSSWLWVLMLDGWEHSHGVKVEIDYAVSINMAIRFVDVSWLTHMNNDDHTTVFSDRDFRIRK